MPGKETSKDWLLIKKQLRFLMDRNIDYISGYNCAVSWIKNNTGFDTVRGELVEASAAVDFAVVLLAADGNDCVGSMLVDGIPNGEICPIACGKIAPVLLEDGTAATRHFWARGSIAVPGRAIINIPAPPFGGVAQLDDHMKEVGHGANSIGAGVNVIAYVHMHFL